MTISVEMLFHAIMFFGAAAFTLWFFGRAWPAYCTDVFRHRCFELRELLFMIAVSGRIGFNDPIYVELRHYLNSRLRFAHTDMLGILFAVIIALRGKVPTINPIDSRIAALNDVDLRNDLRSIYWATVQATIMHIIVKSPIILALIMALTPLILLIDVVIGGLRIQRKIREAFIRIGGERFPDAVSST